MNRSGRMIVVALVAGGCGGGGSKPPGTAAVASPARPAIDGGVVVAPSSPDAAAVDPAVAGCLDSGEMRAVVTLASGTPDCSGIGHEHLVFDVVHGAEQGIQKAYLSCPLSGCSPLVGGAGRAKDGSVWVAVLTADARPARTVTCVAVPATQASVSCAVAVDSVEAGRRLLDAR